MKREWTNKINWILDNLVPPLIRDNRIIMKPFFYLLFKDKYKYFFDFRRNNYILENEKLNSIYSKLEKYHLKRLTDLNEKSIEIIKSNLIGNTVLDIACGRGYLTEMIAKNPNLDVIGSDFVISDNLMNKKNIKYIHQNIENLQFEDNYFDTVVCAHTLEHTIDIKKALSELRRVTKKRLIIVVPRQREYAFSFDLHLHFFPYEHTFRKLLGDSISEIFIKDNDFIYIQNFE